jgi:hypothetical protein
MKNKCLRIIPGSTAGVGVGIDTIREKISPFGAGAKITCLCDCTGFYSHIVLVKKLLQKIKFDRLRIYFQVTNLFTITNYGGLDPTLGTRNDGNSPDAWSGVDYGNYPSARILMIGLNIGF